MNWHYEREGQTVGPVTEEAIQALRAGGQVGPQTRVWREGWPDWKTAAEAWPSSGAAVPAIPPGSTPCAECGAFDPGAVVISGVTICANCKPLAVEKMREGVVLGAGPWQDGKKLVMRKDVPLPHRCLKCGEPPVKLLKKTLSWHSPYVYLAILPGVLIYLIVALCVRKTIVLGVPLCTTCLGKRRRNNLIAWGGFLAAVGLFVAGIRAESHGSLGGMLLFGGVVMLLASLIWVATTQLVLPKKIDEQHAWIAKVGQPFLSLLPKWPGS